MGRALIYPSIVEITVFNPGKLEGGRLSSVYCTTLKKSNTGVSHSIPDKSYFL